MPEEFSASPADIGMPQIVPDSKTHQDVRDHLQSAKNVVAKCKADIEAVMAKAVSDLDAVDHVHIAKFRSMANFVRGHVAGWFDEDLR